MSHRPLVVAFGLTFGDYLLWNWSLNTNHDALALVSGLTLPLLVLVSASLFALSLARLLARSALVPAARRGRIRVSAPPPGAAARPGGPPSPAGLAEGEPASDPSAPPASKLAA